MRWWGWMLIGAGGALLIILLSLSAIVWIALALRQLNVVTSQGQDVWMLVKMTTLALPNLMAIIAPFSLLIAAIHTLNRLNTDSELIVLTASGATIWSAARPLLLLAVIVAGALALMLLAASVGANAFGTKLAAAAAPNVSVTAPAVQPTSGIQLTVRPPLP